MSFSPEAGYGQVRQQTASPRSVEQKLLLQIASDLETCDPKTVDGYKALAVAINKNTDLWTVFATDLASPENQFPDELKQSLVKLAAFALAHGAKVLKGDESVAPLVNVNRAVASGLRQSAQEAA